MNSNYTIKEVADRLGFTVQNLYGQQEDLKSQGFLVDGTRGKEITEEGYNYLRNKRAESTKIVNLEIQKEKPSKDYYEVENGFLKEKIEFLENQVKDLKSDKNLYRNQLETVGEDKELFKKMLLQKELEAKQTLLDTAENNKKRGWLFGRKSLRKF